jgi:hypothetical protein
MKRLLIILITIFAVMAMSVPAMAAVDTGVSISGGSGDEPLIKAKWETPDADPTKPETQIMPPVSYQGWSPIEFWAVVTDNPITDISVVSVDVYHPSGPPECESFKFQVILNPYLDAFADGVIDSEEAAQAIEAFDMAYYGGLVTLNEEFSYEDVVHELSQGEAWIWCGAYEMYYHQPAGWYWVDAFAIDAGPVAEVSHLINQFEYVAVTAAEFDFTSLNYGSITTDGVISGDSTFGTAAPTMRNLGNTWLQVQVQQDDMGFGQSTTGWNVAFDARVGSLTDRPQGSDGTFTVYDPAFAKGPTSPDPGKWTTLPGVVHLCNTWKMDFSIHIYKAIYESYQGSLWLNVIPVDFTGPNISHPGNPPLVDNTD